MSLPALSHAGVDNLPSILIVNVDVTVARAAADYRLATVLVDYELPARDDELVTRAKVGSLRDQSLGLLKRLLSTFAQLGIWGGPADRLADKAQARERLFDRQLRDFVEGKGSEAMRFESHADLYGGVCPSSQAVKGCHSVTSAPEGTLIAVQGH